MKQTRTLDSVDYALTRAYDSGGFLRGITYPDGDAVGTTLNPLGYDAAGRLTLVPGILNGVTYDAAGRPLVQTNANGTVTTRTYSAERGFLKGINTVGGTTIQNLSYTLTTPGFVGLVTLVTSPFANEGWSYGYDDLYRLTQSTNTSDSAQSQTFQYDAIGRITNNSRVGNYLYPNDCVGRPHAPCIAGSNTYTYDANGNMLSGAGRTLAWDANNRLTQAIVSSTTTSFIYDGDGDRLKKQTGTSATLYPLGDDDYEIAPNGTITKYFSMHGVSIAKRVGSGGGAQTFWLHTDRLGSVQAITDSAGALVQRRTYRPYGEKIADSTGHVESKGWINERHDGETALTYLHARYYDPALGTFISPDAMHPAEAGVGLHRYGYGFGNPINLTDRSGAWICVPYGEGNSSGGVWCWDDTKVGGSGGGGGGGGGGGCPDIGDKVGCGGGNGGGGGRGDIPKKETTCEERGDCPQPTCEELGNCPKPEQPECKAGDLTCGPKKDDEKKEEKKSSNPFADLKDRICSGSGYVDINFTAGYWGGVTGGVMLSRRGANFYAGGGVTSPGVAVTFTGSPSNPSPGLNGGVSVLVDPIGGAFQRGYGAIGRNGSAFSEGGIGFGVPGGSAMLYWVSRSVGSVISCN